MFLRLRHFALAFSLLVSFHCLATFTSPSYSTATQSSLHSLRTKWSATTTTTTTTLDGTSNVPHDPRRPSAAFVILCRNADLSKMLMSLQSLEGRFNSKPQNKYPYVFLNDDDFSECFERRIRAAIPSDVQVEFFDHLDRQGGFYYER